MLTMSWFDSGASGAAVDTGLSAIGMIPAYGTALSAIQTGWHGGSAIGHLINGDTRSAAESGVNAGISAVGLIPFVGEAASAAQTGWNATMTGARLGGASDEQAPTASQAITNWILGPRQPGDR
jgi:hypothetical protein